MKSNLYEFECYPMPWTEIALSVASREVGNHPFLVQIDLIEDEIQELVAMTHWAWDNEWFEHSTSETVCSELLMKFHPDIYEKIRVQAHKQFCEKFPNSEDVVGFGDYEIFNPDEIDSLARKLYNKD